MNAGLEKFKKATEDRKFMSMYYMDITKTKRFEKALKNGIKSSGKIRQQEFEDIIFSSWNTYLIDTGRAQPSEKLAADKESFRREVFSLLEDLKDIEFKVLDEAKGIGAIKFEDSYFEVKVTKHKKKAVEKLEIADKVNPFVAELGEKLSVRFSIVRLKNNALTIEVDNQQTTINFTKKRQKLL